MDLIDRLEKINDRINLTKEQVQTEEATKNAFVMPFIQSLGYDVFNPLEVVPEFTADVGTKKGEKVDYCILKDNKPIIIIECKHWTDPLKKYGTQLFRYFTVTHAKFAILTNGVKYKFFTDLNEINKMDQKPFLEFSIDGLTEGLINELKKFHKDSYDENSILNSANDLLYTREIKNYLSRQMTHPDTDFVKLIAKNVYEGKIVHKKVLEQFEELTKKSFKGLLTDRVNVRLQSAIDKEVIIEEQEIEEEEAAERKIETTEEELQGFRIIQSILRQNIDVKRISYRDTQSYFGVLLDDNNRKIICRLRFNSSQKYLGVLDAEKNESKFPINELEDLYQYSKQLNERAEYLIGE